MEKDESPKWIANFWKRIAALFIDVLLVGVIGFLIGLIFESTLVQIGNWGRLVGFSIALLYFGVMNSEICKGQTLGKRLLKISVVNTQGSHISVQKSLLRYVVFATPFYVNGLHLSSEDAFSFLIYPLSAIIFGGIFSTLYLYVFNRVTRQSLHDAVLGTYVVNTDVEKQEPAKVWKVHFIVTGILFVVAIGLPAITSKLIGEKPFTDMLNVQSALQAEAEVNFSTVLNSTASYGVSGEASKRHNYMTVDAFIASNRVSDVDLAKDLAEIVIREYPEAKAKDTLFVTLRYGYTLVIWSRWTSQTHKFNPKELGE